MNCCQSRLTSLKRTVAALITISSCFGLHHQAQAASYQFLEDQAEPLCNVTFTPATATTGKLTVVFDYLDDNNFYALDLAPKTASLRSVIKGVSHPLASAVVPIKPTSSVTLKRRPWLMQVIIDRRVVLTAYDATFTSGKVGSSGIDGWDWKDARIQPLEEIYFSDDFTRDKIGQEGDWKPSSGVWKLTAASTTVTVANREMSANPFSYQVTTGPVAAFAKNGRWFWDNYEAQVSIKPHARGMIGIAAYVQDEKNYIGFQWHSAEGATARELVRVVDGKPTVLAHSTGAFLPRQWYRLGMRTSPGYIETFIDGEPVFKVPNDWFGQGGIAILAQNASGVNFDDAQVKSYPFYNLDFTNTVPAASSGTGAKTAPVFSGGAWTAQHGIWRAQNGQLTSASAVKEKGATRFILTGRKDWKRYQMTTVAQAGKTGACGVVVGYHDDANYAVFRWAGAGSTLPFRGRQQLLRYRNGQAKILSDQPLNLDTNEDGFASIKVNLAAGVFTVYNGDDIIAQMTDESSLSGRPGLWAQGLPNVSFRDVTVSFPVEAAPPSVATRMASDPLMVQYGWASAAGEWLPVDGPAGKEFWNTGEFFGNGSLEFKWKPTTTANGKLELSLRSERGKFDSGLVVRCEDQGADKGFQLTLLRAGQVVKKRLFVVKSASGAKRDVIPVRVNLEGRALLLSIAGQPALSYLNTNQPTATKAEAEPTNTDETAVVAVGSTGGAATFAGTSIAARATGFTLDPNSLSALSSHREDYTFTAAPTDWYAPQGNWGVSSRWPCTTDWSFFGARGTIPVMWHKRTYRGDMVIEAYVHNMMDQATPPYYTKPGNLNVTIGGDGKNPTSGYSFIYAGWQNTKSAILRGTKVVAENKTNKAYYVAPVIAPGYLFHRGWTYIRAEVRQTRQDGRSGVLTTFTVNKDKLAEYFDPTPLPTLKQGGRVAFWTVNSSMSIARIKIETAANGPHSLPPGLLDISTPEEPKTEDNKSATAPKFLLPRAALDSEDLPTALIEKETASPSDKPSWIVRDPASGGPFQVNLTKPEDNPAKPTAWQVTPKTHLDLDLAVPTETNIDIYVTIDGVRHVVNLSGIAKSASGKYDGTIKVLGDVAKLTEAKAPETKGSEAKGAEAKATEAKAAETVVLTADTAATDKDWQHIVFDLGGALKKLYPNAATWKMTEISLGALHGDDYRWAGFNGNLLGATYRLRAPQVLEEAPQKLAAN